MINEEEAAGMCEYSVGEKKYGLYHKWGNSKQVHRLPLEKLHIQLEIYQLVAYYSIESHYKNPTAKPILLYMKMPTGEEKDYLDRVRVRIEERTYYLSTEAPKGIDVSTSHICRRQVSVGVAPPHGTISLKMSYLGYPSTSHEGITYFGIPRRLVCPGYSNPKYRLFFDLSCTMLVHADDKHELSHMKSHPIVKFTYGAGKKNLIGKGKRGFCKRGEEGEQPFFISFRGDNYRSPGSW